MPPVIEVENLSKLYRLGEVSTGTLSHDLNRWWHRVRGKEDPYLKIGQVNDRTKTKRKAEKLKSESVSASQPSEISAFQNLSISAFESDYVYALKDINFSVNQGEVLGIIGRNGAGKSTLLKILSRVTAPTSGRIKVKGRIASLLEVGTGFHPELTGRENIYLNGAILGMRRHEITRKLDEIVDFSGCAAYLDTPVKRYSSGMIVRLAFAVAAFLEAEILIIDEVLAVGDVEFQKKCLGKMGDVALLGRTLLFVSHNMSTIQRLCSRVALIESGTVTAEGSASTMVSQYFKLNTGTGSTGIARWSGEDAPGDHSVKLRSLSIASGDSLPGETDQILSSKPLNIFIEFDIRYKIEKLLAGFEVSTSDGITVLTSYQLDVQDEDQPTSRLGLNMWVATIPPGYLNSGQYLLTPFLADHKQRWICRVDAAVTFNITLDHGQSQIWREQEALGIKRPGIIAPVLNWK
jgi:lipopolysaccharide transport system ATP-binding protein